MAMRRWLRSFGAALAIAVAAGGCAVPMENADGDPVAAASALAAPVPHGAEVRTYCYWASPGDRSPGPTPPPGSRGCTINLHAAASSDWRSLADWWYRTLARVRESVPFSYGGEVVVWRDVAPMIGGTDAVWQCPGDRNRTDTELLALYESRDPATRSGFQTVAAGAAEGCLLAPSGSGGFIG
jgi:hypothetical protein